MFNTKLDNIQIHVDPLTGPAKGMGGMSSEGFKKLFLCICVIAPCYHWGNRGYKYNGSMLVWRGCLGRKSFFA